MNLVIYSWNGYQINDWWWNNQVGEYSSEFPVGERGNLSGQGVYSDIAYSFPKLSTSQVGGHQISFAVLPKSLTHSVSYLREQLKQYFPIGKDFTPHKLIAQDIENGNKQWYLSGIPVNFQEAATGKYIITLALDDPIWRVVTASTTGNVAVVASPNTQNLTIIGNVPVPPVITIKPTSNRSGAFAYRRYVNIYNATTNPFPLFVSSVDITNGGLNTAALVSGGKMQATGADVRVMVDGNSVDYWFGGGGINSTTTLIWCNIPHSIGQIGTLLTALPNASTPVTVTFQKTTNNLNVLKALAQAVNTAFIIGSEIFTYSKSNVDLVNYQITSCNRAQKNTAAAAHSTAANITWIEHDVWLLYGDPTATAPSNTNRYQPIIDLTNSRNTSWVWSNFHNEYVPPVAQWNWFVASSITDGIQPQGMMFQTYVFHANQGVFYAVPSTEMGLVMRTVLYNNVEKPETASLGWRFYHPAGFTNVSMSGNKYTQYAASWPAVAGLQKSIDGISYTSVWNEAIPTNIALWTNTFTHNSVTLSGTYFYLQVLFSGSIPANSGNQAFIQCDTVTVVLGSGILTVALSAETGNYALTSTILNNTSGEYLLLNITMQLNQTLTIDCGAKTATLDDGTNVFNGITLSPNRTNPAWLNFGNDTNQKFVGTAQIVYTETGLTAETLNYTWNDGSL